MIVIADTTPIITLLKLERLELLEKFSGKSSFRTPCMKN